MMGLVLISMSPITRSKESIQARRAAMEVVAKKEPVDKTKVFPKTPEDEQRRKV